MTLGEIVEILIRVRDDNDLTYTEDKGICAACNILDKFPANSKEQDVKDWLNWQVQ